MGDHTYIGWFGGGLYKMNNRTFAIDKVPHFAQQEAVEMMFRIGGDIVVQMLDYSCYLTDQDFNIKVSAKLPEDSKITVLKDKIYQVSMSGQVDLLDHNLRVIKKNLFPGITSRITAIVCHRDNK